MPPPSLLKLNPALYLLKLRDGSAAVLDFASCVEHQAQVMPFASAKLENRLWYKLLQATAMQNAFVDRKIRAALPHEPCPMHPS